MSNNLVNSLILGGLLTAAAPLYAADYVIDTQGAHASVNFKVNHLGYSWLTGRFNKFDGQFSYDPENPGAAEVEVAIDATSLDTNHAERDKHLRSGDFLDVGSHPKISFVSNSYTENGDGSGVLMGDLTLHGVTKPVEVQVHKIGGGNDPWGGYRMGFQGSTQFKLKDFGIDFDLGPASEVVYLDLNVEGVRQ